jgi:hypothetical protein
MTCDACRDLLPWYAAQLLSKGEHDRVERHLATCKECRAELAAWQQIASATNDDLSRVMPSVTTADAWKQLQEHITPDPSANGRRRGDRFMEFGDQSELIKTGTRPPHPSAQARRMIIAAGATLFVILLSVISFWHFAPTFRPGSNGIDPKVSATPTTHQGAHTPIQTPVMGKSYTNVNSLPVIKNPTSIFLANDTVIVVAKVVGAKAGDTVSVKWFQNGEDLTPAFLTESSHCCSQTMSGQPEDAVFQAQFPGIGSGKVELYYNSTLAYTLDFDIITMQATPTSHA